uniref:Uncharacterized protein n=1 Tax=Anopheles atroparvus TaxID=41427 RepID=A0AAG5D3X4_ANOAO
MNKNKTRRSSLQNQTVTSTKSLSQLSQKLIRFGWLSSNVSFFLLLLFYFLWRRIFKFSTADVQASEHLLHASVLSMVEFDDDIFAGGNCFDWNQHPAKRGLFCPFAYRLPPPDQGASLVKDLALEYHYLGNTSEWFFLARKNAEKVIARNEQYIKSSKIPIYDERGLFFLH